MVGAWPPAPGRGGLALRCGEAAAVTGRPRRNAPGGAGGGGSPRHRDRLPPAGGGPTLPRPRPRPAPRSASQQRRARLFCRLCPEARPPRSPWRLRDAAPRAPGAAGHPDSPAGPGWGRERPAGQCPACWEGGWDAGQGPAVPRRSLAPPFNEAGPGSVPPAVSPPPYEADQSDRAPRSRGDAPRPPPRPRRPGPGQYLQGCNSDVVWPPRLNGEQPPATCAARTPCAHPARPRAPRPRGSLRSRHRLYPFTSPSPGTRPIPSSRAGEGIAEGARGSPRRRSGAGSRCGSGRSAGTAVAPASGTRTPVPHRGCFLRPQGSLLPCIPPSLHPSIPAPLHPSIPPSLHPSIRPSRAPGSVPTPPSPAATRAGERHPWKPSSLASGSNNPAAVSPVAEGNQEGRREGHRTPVHPALPLAFGQSPARGSPAVRARAREFRKGDIRGQTPPGLC
ncbi:basic salivary proline-rich protein 4-like [Phaenicophaeus curvirostris]|uniref:basic salivary proline-rich protein 4-like n=1 Tax=Phaenicophaeus curvirostris TaxID=33595 RepID=UPI0037F0DFB1